MADTTLLAVDGLKELRSSLKAAGGDLSDLKEANLSAARIVAPASQAAAPRGKTGQLAASIRTSGTLRAGIVRAGSKRIPYAQPIHWGWPRPSARHPTARGGPIPPNPFLTRAAQQTEPEWVAVYRQHLDDILATIKGASWT